MTEQCSIEGCDKPAERLGWCSKHLTRWKRHGDPLILSRTPPGESLAFVKDVAASFAGDECLRWPFLISTNGYGFFRLNGRHTYAHRMVCEMAHGSPPPNADAAHSCGNRWCVNHEHLRWASRSENLADARVHGTIGGERNSQAKLTTQDVRAIRGLLAGGKGVNAIARDFGVSSQCISGINTRRSWKHIW